MTCSADQAYRFATPGQWNAGAHDLEFVDGRLDPPMFRCLELIEGVGVSSSPAGSLPAVDVCGRLNWLSPETRQWQRLHDFGVETVGRLVGDDEVLDMVLGCGVIWLRTAVGLERHDAHDLRYLGPVPPPGDSSILAIAADQQHSGQLQSDGLWVLATEQGRTELSHLDRWGRSCHDSISLPCAVPGSASIVASSDGRSVFVLLLGESPDGSAGADFPALYIVSRDSDSGEPNGSVEQLPVDFAGRVPLSMAFDAPDSVVLLSELADDPGAVVIDTFDQSGGLLRQELLDIPPGMGGVLGLSSGPEPIVRGTDGLANLVACERDEAASTTFITPKLTAPIAGKGWNRAELTALIPEGSVVQLDWFSTSDPAVAAAIDEVFADPKRSPLSRLQALADLIPWPDEGDEAARCQPIGSSSDPDQPTVSPILLDQAEGPDLWARVTMVTPAGRTAPSLLSLDVLYGNDSYIDELPAIYREDPFAASQLRQVLAPFEVVFDQLDAAIAALPDRLDPATAPDEWTNYLLSWLGVPSLGDLDPTMRRGLLEAMPDLLETRGTVGALTTVLNIVTDDRATVRDRSQEPAAWFLPVGNRNGGSMPPRLGLDSVARSQQPAPFRPGTVILGQIPLGVGCPDPELVLAESARLVTITIDVPADEAQALAPIIDRLLAVFMPAHCRVEVIYSETDRATRAPQLGVDFRLADDDAEGSQADGPAASRLYSDGHWRLGATDRVGAWQLPDRLRPDLILDRPNAPGRDPFLS